MLLSRRQLLQWRLYQPIENADPSKSLDGLRRTWAGECWSCYVALRLASHDSSGWPLYAWGSRFWPAGHQRETSRVVIHCQPIDELDGDRITQKTARHLDGLKIETRKGILVRRAKAHRFIAVKKSECLRSPPSQERCTSWHFVEF